MRGFNNNRKVVLSPHKRGFTGGYVIYLGTSPKKYNVDPKEYVYLLTRLRIGCQSKDHSIHSDIYITTT